MSSYSHPRGLCVDTLILDRVYRGVCLDLSGGPLRLLEESPPGALDLRGLGSIALPGVVDMHVHLRGLELSYKEDESTGTLAALSGCITAVVDMPNTKPPLKTLKALRAKLGALRDGAYVDYGVYAGVPDDEATVYELSSEPIAGFKVYPEDLRAPRGVLCSILKTLALKGGILIVHAEHPDMLCVDYGFYRNTYRGCHVEAAAVDEVARLVKECGFKPRIHITHASCPSTVVKAKSYGFTVDVTPHHLLFDEDGFKPLASSWCESKVNPPLRGVVERSLLWRLLLEGYVDAIASDHAPHAPHEKLWLHPSQCSPGFPSLEDWVGALARLFNSINLLPLFAELTSINPARILGLPPRAYSGSLSILALDLEESPGPIYSKARVSPYLNVYRLRCLATVIRGRIAYLKGEVMVGRGFGVNLFEARG
mgnify:CR=1 FL=1